MDTGSLREGGISTPSGVEKVIRIHEDELLRLEVPRASPGGRRWRNRGGALGRVLGSRVRTASRNVSPCGTVAPHVSQVRPLRFTASQTRQRQTALMKPLDQ